MLRTRLARLHARRLSRASQYTLEYLAVYHDTMADLQALETAEPETVAAFFAAAVLPLLVGRCVATALSITANRRGTLEPYIGSITAQFTCIAATTTLQHRRGDL